MVCPSTGISVPSNPCGPTRLFCKSGECIEVDKRCDGRVDCVDASDEANCAIENGVEAMDIGNDSE